MKENQNKRNESRKGKIKGMGKGGEGRKEAGGMRTGQRKWKK